MPLFRANSPSQSLGKRAAANTKAARKRWKEEEEGCVQSLSQLCLWSVADNMTGLWVKDYAENYLDKYDFRHVMGPFDVLQNCQERPSTSCWCPSSGACP